MLLTAATVIAHDGLLQPGWIQIDGHRVTAAGAGARPPEPGPGRPGSGRPNRGPPLRRHARARRRRWCLPDRGRRSGQGSGRPAPPARHHDQHRLTGHRRPGRPTADRRRDGGTDRRGGDRRHPLGRPLAVQRTARRTRTTGAARPRPGRAGPGVQRRAGDDPDGHAGAGTHRDSTRCGRWSRPGQWRRGSWITAPVGGAVPVGSTAPHDRH